MLLLLSDCFILCEIWPVVEFVIVSTGMAVSHYGLQVVWNGCRETKHAFELKILEVKRESMCVAMNPSIRLVPHPRSMQSKRTPFCVRLLSPDLIASEEGDVLQLVLLLQKSTGYVAKIGLIWCCWFTFGKKRLGKKLPKGLISGQSINH